MAKKKENVSKLLKRRNIIRGLAFEKENNSIKQPITEDLNYYKIKLYN